MCLSKSQGEFNYFPKCVKTSLIRLKSPIWHLKIAESNSTHAITPGKLISKIIWGFSQKGVKI